MPSDEAEYWDQVSAFRTFAGIFEFGNKFLDETAYSGYIDLHHDKKNAELFINCNDTFVEKYTKGIPSNHYEMSMAGSVFDFIMPAEFKINVQHLIGETASYNATTAERIKELGLDKAGGYFKLVRDPKLLKQLESTTPMKPGMTKFPTDVKDELDINFMDRIETRHNFFAEYHGGPNKDETIILPFEVSIDFMAAFRKGIGSRHGPTQEYASKFLWPTKVDFKKCQKIKSTNLLVGDKNDMIDTICSDDYRGLANYVYNQRSDLYQEWWGYKMAPARFNVYYPFMEIEFSYTLLCAGIELWNP